jgi:hypothetical protein
MQKMLNDNLHPDSIQNEVKVPDASKGDFRKIGFWFFSNVRKNKAGPFQDRLFCSLASLGMTNASLGMTTSLRSG